MVMSKFTTNGEIKYFKRSKTHVFTAQSVQNITEIQWGCSSVQALTQCNISTDKLCGYEN